MTTAPGSDAVVHDLGALAEARKWARVHGHQPPDDRMLAAYGAKIYEVAHRAGREDAAEAVWAKATELRGKPFRSGAVGIEYVNGMEDASEIARGNANNAQIQT